MKNDNKTSARSDTTQPSSTIQSKSKKRDEEYLAYQRYIRGKEWKSIRDRVLERDGYRCQCCSRSVEEDGQDIGLSVHHSTYSILYHETEGDNLKYLVTLCKYCHKGIHSVKSNYKRFNMKGKVEGKS